MSTDEELHILLVSKYCHIIKNIMNSHHNLGITQLMVFSYIKKKMDFVGGNIYRKGNKKDILIKCLSLMSGYYTDFCKNIEYILPAIDLCIKNDFMTLQGHSVYINDIGSLISQETFLDNAIEESKLVSETQFLKEVLQVV